MFLQRLCKHVNQNKKISKKNLIFITNWRSLKITPQKAWNFLHALLLSNTSFSTPSFLTVNNETFTNLLAKANQLNHHFVNIGKSLKANLSGSNDNSYLTYLKSPFPSIYFLSDNSI